MENFSLTISRFTSLTVVPPATIGSQNRCRRRPLYPPLPPAPRKGSRFVSRPASVVAAFGFGRRNSGEKAGKETVEVNDFARISSPDNNQMTTSTSTPALPVPPSSSYIGSPLLWIGVGVGLSVVFQVVAARVKRYALQQAFKTMMDQAAPQGAQFSNPMFSPGSQFPFPPAPSTPSPPASAPVMQTSSQPVWEVDAAVTEVETTPSYEIKDGSEVKETKKKYAFVDVSPEELVQAERSYSRESIKESAPQSQPQEILSSNGTVKQESASGAQSQSQSRRPTPPLSVDALEKMLEDPTVQKMVYPYLPEEMRNPTSFKWMMQNPQFRQQMEEMLNNMGGSAEWDNRMTDTLKNFDLSSPEVKQQFEQIGLTPEEVISKIMANPDVAMAFQNPKVQAAILDCSQNPLSIAKYQNDKEVMDVFTKISELFPGVTGYP